jgi:putative ABC transport system substrate-binding protein
MKRRQFITLLGGAAAWPLAARAQLAAMPVIGLSAAGRWNPTLLASLSSGRGLNEAGFVAGRNVMPSAEPFCH